MNLRCCVRKKKLSLLYKQDTGLGLRCKKEKTNDQNIYKFECEKEKNELSVC